MNAIRVTSIFPLVTTAGLAAASAMELRSRHPQKHVETSMSEVSAGDEGGEENVKEIGSNILGGGPGGAPEVDLIASLLGGAGNKGGMKTEVGASVLLKWVEIECGRQGRRGW